MMVPRRKYRKNVQRAKKAEALKELREGRAYQWPPILQQGHERLAPSKGERIAPIALDM